MQQPTYSLRNSKVICNVVLIGTYIVIAAISTLLFINFSVNHVQLLSHLMVCGIALLYVAATQILSRVHYKYAVAYLLVLFYLFLATGIVWSWGVNTPVGILIFGLVIVLAGILLTARHAIFAWLTTTSILAFVQTSIHMHWHNPDTSWTGNTSSYGDVLGYCVVFGMLALVSWLYNREMERLLAHAQLAEAALLQQKATLKMQVRKRTAELRHVQFEEMQQMYRFAELGQRGVTLLHDLANHLTALTLEIECMQSKQHAEAISRVQRIIHYLEEIVESTRARLHGSTQKQTFDIGRKVSEVITFLQPKAARAHVAIDWQPPQNPWKYTGDPDSLCQIIAIITSNAIDAYGVAENKTFKPSKRRVHVAMEHSSTDITIRITDWGKGITKVQRKHLFKPIHSTKKTGLGLGLYIAKQTAEMQFSGNLVINALCDNTEFIVTLPVSDGR